MFKHKIERQEFNYGYKISKQPNGRRIVIPDIHGCALTFKALLFKKIRITKEDQLFLLGDYIDRGKRNLETIDLILDLINSGFRIFPLRGNHEENLIEAWEDFKSLKHRKDKNFKNWIYSIDLLDQDNSLKPRVRNFINILPYYYELDKFVLVHAGFNFQITNPFEDYDSMIRIRKPSENKFLDKTIIHGHVVKDLNKIKEQITDRSNVLSIDNGCVYKDLNQENELGNLLGLDIDSYKLFIQGNIENEDNCA